jgi:hypothetical protein
VEFWNPKTPKPHSQNDNIINMDFSRPEDADFKHVDAKSSSEDT